MSVATVALRDSIRRLIDLRSPADGLAAYYALYHPPDRTELFLWPPDAVRPVGFLVRARTGYDLFRPLVTLRAADPDSVIGLLQLSLVAGRPAFLFVPDELANLVTTRLQVTEAERLRIYLLESGDHEPVINVLVTRAQAPGGLPRYEIRSGDQLAAAAGLNWRSPEFAEIYVHVHPAGRERGWGKSVVSALVSELLGSGVRPLYQVAETNSVSIRLAESLGFRDTGFREFSGQVVLRD